MKSIIFYGLFLFTTIIHASNWSDVWKNMDQRAFTLLEKGQFEAAEKAFIRKDWQAVAAFRNKNYIKAAQGFENQGGAEGFYNQGNALAFQGKYKQAIEAYQKALKHEPKHLDAKHNLTILENALKKNPPASDQSDKSKQQTDKANNDESNENQETSSQNETKQNTSDSKQDDSNQPPSKPESSKSDPKPDPKSDPKSNAESGSDSEPNEKRHAKTQQAPETLPNHADKQAKEQWLRLIPDDPGGLLREKFWRDHMKRSQQRLS